MGFATAFELEKETAALKKKDLNEGCIRCPKCKTNTWFEEVKVQQFLDDHQVIIGQGVPPKGHAAFIVLRCIKCSEVIEPRLLRQSRDAINQAYDNFLDSMQSTEVKADKV